MSRKFVGIVCGLFLAGLNSCQTYPVRRDKKEEIRATLLAYKHSVNTRSYDALRPLLARTVSLDGLPDELSRAALMSGAQWPPTVVEELQTLSISGSPDGFQAKVGLYMPTSVLTLKIGFDPECKIRSISGDPLWKASETRASAPFASAFTAVDGLPFVKATLDGRSGYFLFDTGSSCLLLNRKYFNPSVMPCTPGFSATVNGLTRPVGALPVHSLEWGCLRAKDLTGQLHDFSHMERPEITPLLGAISHKEIRNSSVAFDWKKRTIRIFPTKADGTRKPIPGETPPTVRIPFAYFLHMPVVKARIGAKDYDLLFDSGAQLNLLPDTNGLDGHFRQTGFLAGFSSGGDPGSAHAPLGTLDRLKLGAAEYLNLPFAIYRIPYLQGNGMIGTPLLQQGRVEINFRARQISLWR